MSDIEILHRIEAGILRNNHLLESIREKLERVDETNIETSRKLDSVPLATREAAQMFGCCADTFIKHARKQHVQPISGWNRSGGHYSWYRSDVDRMIRKRDRSTEQMADAALFEFDELRKAI